MAPRMSGFTRASSLGPIADLVGRLGGSVERIFVGVDLPPSLLDTPDLVLPLREQFRLLEGAARETGDLVFGARLGTVVRSPNLSAYGAWVCKGRTLGEAVQRAEAGLTSMLQTATVLRFAVVGETATWSIEFLDPECEGRHHNELLGLGYMMDVVRAYAGCAWKPFAIGITQSDESVERALRDLYGTTVTRGCAVTRMSFGARLLLAGLGSDQTAADASPSLEPVPPSDDLVASTLALIELALLDGYPRMAWVAGKLGCSVRSLQRLLAEERTTFQALVEDVLRKRALEMLQGSEVSVTEIAHALGYQDAAHFSRACRRWTGLPPSSIRAVSQG